VTRDVRRTFTGTARAENRFRLVGALRARPSKKAMQTRFTMENTKGA
jgi:hypothetical protein